MTLDINDLAASGKPVDSIISGTVPIITKTVIDDVAPKISDLYTPQEFINDLNRTVVKLDRLPTFPVGGWEFGHGLGEQFNREIGGGFTQNFMMAIGASKAGAGKTALLMQLAEGLAARSSLDTLPQEEPLTPVLVLSEMNWRGLSWRSLARHLSINYQFFRLGRQFTDRDEIDYDGTVQRVTKFISGDGRSVYTFLRYFDVSKRSGPELIKVVGELVKSWRDEIAEVYPTKQIWPVIVIDPIQRFQDPTKSEVESLNQISEELIDFSSRNGCIVLVSSDTNKAAAKGGREADDDGAGAFRGSYKLMHAVDVAIVLKPGEYIGSGKYMASLRLVKNRWAGNLSVFKCAYVPRYSRYEDIEIGP